VADVVTTASYPVTPTVEPLRGTLLDAATVSDNFAWLEGTDLFESFNCMKFQADATFCAPSPKTFDQAIVWQDGFRFAAYGGVQCKAIGLDQANMEREVQRVFEAGESTAVERALMETRFKADGGGLWAAPTDITPAGGAVSPEVGLGTLEGYAASEYVGVPTLHLPRVIVSVLATKGMLEWDGQVLRTKLGSKIAAGAGYDYPNLSPTGTQAAVGEKWLYATGEVVVGRGPAIVRQVMAESTNEVFVLGERGYIAAVDCFAAAVRVTVTS
jgi:hypothetical protein